MKKLMNIFVLVAAAAMALASCQKPEIENPEPQSYEYTFLIGDADASDDSDSKAVIGPNCVEWVSGDQMGVYTRVAAGTISNNAYGDITPGSPATMKVYSNQALAIGDYIYAYYPYSSANENQNLSVTLEIPAEQDGKDDMPMVAIPHRVESALISGEPQNAPAGKIKFANLGSVIEFNVYTETEEYASEVVTSVAFEADNALAGAFTFDLTNVNYSEASTLSISELTEKEVVANVSDLAVGTKAEPAIVRMVVAPGSYKGNVVVTTDKATYTFPISTEKEFKRSAIKPLGLKLREDVREENASREVTISFATTDQRESQDANQQKWMNDDVEFINDKGESTSNVADYFNPVRLYKSSSITITAPGNITMIVFNSEANSSKNAFLDDLSNVVTNPIVDGTKVTVKLDGTSNTVTYELTSGQVRLYDITVTYTATGEVPETKTLTSIAVEEPETEYVVGEEFVEPKVKATYSDDTSAEVTGATFSGYDMSTAGTQTVTVSYTEGDVTEETSYEITVSEAVILVEDGTYVIAVKEGDAYYAVSTDANGVRREAVELTGYSGGENYVSHDNKIVWTITNVPGGITVSNGGTYWGAKENGISLNAEGASTITVAKSEIEGAFVLSGDCGDDGIRYLAKNGTYGFGFYAESNKDDIYLIPATFVELPTLETPVVSAELNDTNDGINVSWESVTNAEKYLVACGENSVEVTATEHNFTELSSGTYTVTVTAIAENYNSATSEPVTVTVPSAEGTTEWVAKSFADLKDGDEVVILATKESTSWAMANDKGTGSAPTGVTGITYSNNKLTAAPAESIIWYVGVDGNNRIFYKDSGKATWLYCTGTNNGVRVGTNAAKAFTFESNYLKHVGTGRYVGVYTTNPDWRCYTSTTTNIAGQTFLFFVKSGEGSGETPEPEEPEIPGVDVTEYTAEITLSTYGSSWSSYADRTGVVTGTDNKTYTVAASMIASVESKIQARSSKSSIIYNTQSFGNIKSIQIEDATGATFTVTVGKSSNSGCTTNTSAEGTRIFNIATDGNGFFKIVNSNTTIAKITKIKITYTN